MSSRGFLGAGDLYIARQVGGVFLDYAGPFECSKFEIKPNTELKELVSKGRSTYGQVVESVALQKPADLKVELTEVNKDSLALALLGTNATLTQGSGSVTDEVLTAKLDAWRPLTKQAVASVVVTNSTASVTYVENIDYVVNYQLGWIKALSGGAIADAASLKVDYTHSAISGTKIRGATDAQLRAKFKLDGKNYADGLPVIVEVFEAIISADSAFDFLGSDFNTLSLPGRMKTPVGATEPFTVELRSA